VISGTVTAPPTVTNVVVNNTGDLSFYPNMTLTDPGEGTKPVRIFNEQNQSSVTFSQIYNLEVITINAKLKTITSSISNPSESIYVRWQKDELILNPGSNTLRFQTFNNGSWQNTNVAAFSLNGEAPVYIYDTN
jgi:phage-related protein